MYKINNNYKKRTIKKAPKKGGMETLKKLKSKKKLKIIEEAPIKESMEKNEKDSNEKSYNKEFIKILGEFYDIMMKKGEAFRARAYKTAQESIMKMKEPITNISQLKGLPGIGSTILSKLEEYVKTGKVAALEREKQNPLIILTQIHGVGPKKAEKLISEGITTIEQLKENQDKLDNVQKLGLKYYYDIIERIPREEIIIFEKEMKKAFDKYAPLESSFEIVGSYRRGEPTSGDIDVFMTNKNNDKNLYKIILDKLKEENIILDFLSKGDVKSMAVVRILPDKPARRVDFLYSPPKDFAFSLLYFTGSKEFNTAMRQRAKDIGYTLNEHGLSYLVKGKKGDLLDKDFPDEKSIFDFLGMVYKKPEERIDANSVVLKKTEDKQEVPPVEEAPPVEELPPVEEVPQKEKKKTGRKTLKKLKIVQIDNNYVERFKKEGINVLKEMNENELSDLIRKANQLYYCDNNPIFTDNEYDILREYILNKYPNNEAAKEGHTKSNIAIEKNRVKLPYEMWSMDKIKPDTKELAKWIKKYKGPYVLSCKLDGVSGLYSTENNEEKLYTRGDGIYGQDISHLIPYLKLPTKKDITIRGEFIIKKEVFDKKYKGKAANPRNLVAGIINKKTISPEKYKDIDFIAYEVINPVMKPLQQMLYFPEIEVNHVKFDVKETISNEILSETLLKWREEYDYEIDGIIVINDEIYPRPKGNPDYAFAFKMIISEQVAEAKVLDVIWTPSKDGYLKPRVQIEPITLGGVKIEYATGFNAKFIVDNNIGLGALIQIVRSGDVIPHILSTIQPAENPILPDVPYDWNETKVDFVLKDKEDDKTVREKIITAFFKTLGVDGLGPGNIKRIMDAGYDSVPKILAMDIEAFLTVEGFKKTMATKIYNSIQKEVEKSTLPELMSASNIFERGFATQRFKIILAAYPNILTSSESNEEKTAKLEKVEGIAKKTAEKFVKNISKFVKFMEEANLMKKINDYEKQIISDDKKEKHILFGKKIVFTGFRDKDTMETITKLGGELANSVSKNTFVVIVKNKDDDSGKIDQAKKLNIPILTLEEFKDKYL
tara:strand:+ start:5462 stop:8635 length:3174 start_codon:yes stop_codon:yes gene_type:complete